MPETFLYFLWQYQYFQHLNLRTTAGEPLRVLHPGYRNANAGPDFSNARLVLNDVNWVGMVEAHTRTSDWLAHRHQHDRAYDNVILHIVWEDDLGNGDRALRRTDGSLLPTLALKPLTADTLLDRYGRLHDTPTPIPCAGQLRSVNPLKLTSMLDKAMLQRLERKAQVVQAVYDATGADWEETTYRLLAANFGFKLNAEPMEQLARALPLKILRKHGDTLGQLEALLFGTAGWLDDAAPTDDYVATLRREYRFLAAKYALADKQLPPAVWKWGRLRPASFPTLRLAQFARLLNSARSLTTLLLDTDDLPTLLKPLTVTPSPYWQTHYRLGVPSEKVAATLGRASAENIVINTAVPLLAAYAHHRAEPSYIDRAVALLEQLPAEQNHITADWDALGLSVRTAFDSQAVLELNNAFCAHKKCLSCQIGLALVRG